jgi:hypothetical protein
MLRGPRIDFQGSLDVYHRSGLGAAHQTEWPRLLANLAMRRYRGDIPEFWSRQSSVTSLAAQKRPELRV